MMLRSKLVGTVILGTLTLTLSLPATACGGKTKNDGKIVGEDHAVADDLDDGHAAAAGADAGAGAVPAVEVDAGPPPPAVTFAVTNDGDEDLVFSLDKGWQPVIFAFSGKPPKAVPLTMFATAYTASCDAEEADRCPKAPPRPEKNRDEAKAEKRETVAPGGKLAVPWDAQALVYEKTKAGGRKCECYRPAPSPPGDYTVRACGLRRTEGKSKLQCIDAAMTLPSADGKPLTVELHFPKP